MILCQLVKFWTLVDIFIKLSQNSKQKCYMFTIYNRSEESDFLKVLSVCQSETGSRVFPRKICLLEFNAIHETYHVNKKSCNVVGIALRNI